MSQELLKRRSQLKYFLCLLAFLSLSESDLGGTAIAILFNQTEIVVGSDSKSIGGDRNLLCKVFKTGSMYWAFSGMVGKSRTSYYVPALVKSSYASSRSVSKTLMVFTIKSEPALLVALKAMRIEEPTKFELVKNNPLQIAFLAFEKGRPVVGVARYTTDVTGREVKLKILNKEVVDCTKTDCANPNAKGVLLGVHNEALMYASSHRDWGVNLSQSARKFISLSIEEDSRTVGLPINVLTINSDGKYHWDEPNKLCEGGPLDSIPPAKSVVIVK